MSDKCWKIKFQGKDLLLIGDGQRDGPICTAKQYRDGETSYAHLFDVDGGIVMRFEEKIGIKSDIEFVEEIDTPEISEKGIAKSEEWAMSRAFNFPGPIGLPDPCNQQYIRHEDGTSERVPPRTHVKWPGEE